MGMENNKETTPSLPLTDLIGGESNTSVVTSSVIKDSPTPATSVQQTQTQTQTQEPETIVKETPKSGLDLLDEGLVEEKSPVVETQQQQQTQTQQQPDPFEDVDEADRPLFKKMANDAKARMLAVYKERKQQREKFELDAKQLQKQLEEAKKGGLPEAWQEHPEAYVLAPEYKQSVSMIQAIQREKSHWEQQYEAIRRGDDWKDVNEKGEFITRPATAAAEREVLGYLNKADRLTEMEYEKINSLRTSFASKHQSYLDRIETQARGVFPPELHDFEKALQENNYVKVLWKALEEVGQSKSPLAKNMCRLYAVHMKTLQELAALKKGTATQQKPNNITSTDVARQTQTAGKAPADSEILDLSDFEAAKRKDI